MSGVGRGYKTLHSNRTVRELVTIQLGWIGGEGSGISEGRNVLGWREHTSSVGLIFFQVKTHVIFIICSIVGTGGINSEARVDIKVRKVGFIMRESSVTG